MSEKREKIIIEGSSNGPESPVVSEDMSVPFDSLKITYDPNSKNKTKQQREFQELQRLLRQETESPFDKKRSSFNSKQTSSSKQPVDIDFLNVASVPRTESTEIISSRKVVKKDDLESFMSEWEELSELFDYKEFEVLTTLEKSFEKISERTFSITKKWMDISDLNRLEIIHECIENIESNSKSNYFDSLKTLLYISLGCFNEIGTDSKKIQIYQMKENFKLLSKSNVFDLISENSLFFIHQVLKSKNNVREPEVIKLKLNILFIYLYNAKEILQNEEDLKEMKINLLLKETPFISSLFDIILQVTSNKNVQLLPLKKILMVLMECLNVVFGHPTKEPSFLKVKELPKFEKRSDYKLKTNDISKSFNCFDYDKKNHKLLSTLEREKILQKSKTKLNLSEKLKNESKKEIDPKKHEEILYKMLYPNLPKIILSLCKTIFSSLPDSNYKGPISYEDHVDLTNEFDLNRHKQIILNTISEIILNLNYHFKMNNLHQSCYFNFLFFDVNGIIILLKYFSQDLDDLLLNTKHNDSRISILNSKIVKDDNTPLTRISTILINFMKILRNLTKNHPIRINLLINENATKILKKCLKFDIPKLRYYTLKLIKQCIPSCTYKWRKGNMNVISMIYEYLPPDLFENFLVYHKISKKDMTIIDNQFQDLIEDFNNKNYEKMEIEDDDLKEQFKIYNKIVLDDLFYLEDGRTEYSLHRDFPEPTYEYEDDQDNEFWWNLAEQLQMKNEFEGKK
eukprot:gene3270-5713_t